MGIFLSICQNKIVVIEIAYVIVYHDFLSTNCTVSNITLLPFQNNINHNFLQMNNTHIHVWSCMHVHTALYTYQILFSPHRLRFVYKIPPYIDLSLSHQCREAIPLQTHSSSWVSTKKILSIASVVRIELTTFGLVSDALTNLSQTDKVGMLGIEPRLCRLRA